MELYRIPTTNSLLGSIVSERTAICAEISRAALKYKGILFAQEIKGVKTSSPKILGNNKKQKTKTKTKNQAILFSSSSSRKNLQN
mmetsp:Transcript_12775/g.24264  ORF Transcript_12775/g.24264 Transcript_12775/m.24264 type:complete len:85 (+) Transcript_12775:279-533(+)